jgi:hypothetical protein
LPFKTRFGEQRRHTVNAAAAAAKIERSGAKFALAEQSSIGNGC